MQNRESIWDTVRSAVYAQGAAACGVCRRPALESVMSEKQRILLEERLSGWRSVICAAFPYYAALPAPPGAISRYAWGMDYHRVLSDRLAPAAAVLTGAGVRAEVLVDASPVPERAAALLSGIGMLGDHGLVIVPPYGSYVFLGTIVTDSSAFDGMALTEDLSAHCTGCGACRAACPSGALGEDGFHLERCLSHISQKKGELADWERALLRENGCLWGCDACQAACPYNRHPQETDIPELREALTTAVTRDMVEGISNREFRQRWGGRAFAWRGPGVLRRNLDILSEKTERTNREE